MKDTPVQGVRLATALACAVVLLAAQAAHAQGPATCASVPGVLFAKSDSGWKSIGAGDAVPLKTTLVSLFDSTIQSGGVELRMVADPAQRGPLPVLESAVQLHDDAKHDLAVTPLRGLILFTNVKKKGSAVVQLRHQGETVEVTLKGPGAKIALEIYSRHAPGAPHFGDPKQDVPVVHVFIIALAGETFLQAGEKGWTLQAPPGPAILIWDSLLRQPEVQRLEELPPEIVAMKSDKKILDNACAWARKLDGKSLADTLKEGAASTAPGERKAAVVVMSALDELPALLGTLATSPHADTREHAVLALRHWLGRAPGQTAKLDAALIEAGYTKPQSHSLIHLLYGFTGDEQGLPETYDLLLDSLKHSRPAIRQLAHWHLVRLAPAGKMIRFDALGAEADRQKAYDEWRALIPAGKLPPPPPKAGAGTP